MTRRYSGKLLTAETEEDFKEPNVPYATTSMRYKIYKYVKDNGDDGLITSEIHKEVAPNSPRRSVEKSLTDLTNQGLVKRVSCRCGRGYIYTL